jgi:hypothetical protein
MAPSAGGGDIPGFSRGNGNFFGFPITAVIATQTTHQINHLPANSRGGAKREFIRA